jgi:hypothetical protein
MKSAVWIGNDIRTQRTGGSLGIQIAARFGMASTKPSVPEPIRSVLDHADAVRTDAERTIRAVDKQLRQPWPDRCHPAHWPEHDLNHASK